MTQRDASVGRGFWWQIHTNARFDKAVTSVVWWSCPFSVFDDMPVLGSSWWYCRFDPNITDAFTREIMVVWQGQGLLHHINVALPSISRIPAGSQAGLQRILRFTEMLHQKGPLVESVACSRFGGLEPLRKALFDAEAKPTIETGSEK